MIDLAKDAGADAIKFQTFHHSDIAIIKAPLAKYQKNKKIKDQINLLKKLELTHNSQKKIRKYCLKKKISFLSSAFDINSLRFLRSLKQKVFKIPSGEITNLPYLSELGRYNKFVLLSTGASTINEIKFAINTLVKNGTKRKNITVLHCNSEYPTPFNDANLNSIEYLKKILKLNVGYSDHTLGIEASIAAVAKGASVIEKHFTLNKSYAGPDHQASITPIELKELVRSLRNIEKTLLVDKKIVTKSEKKNIKIIRKSIVAKSHIKKNERFSELNLTCKRPGTGISPIFWKKVLGRKAKKNFKKDSLISV